MSESNGDDIVTISRKGMQKFRLGDDGKVFAVDVMALVSNWGEIDRGFKDENGEVPPDRRIEHEATIVQFVRETFKGGGYDEKEVKSINVTEAFAFVAQIAAKANELRPFFELPSGTAPSSPARSPLRFGT